MRYFTRQDITATPGNERNLRGPGRLVAAATLALMLLVPVMTQAAPTAPTEFDPLWPLEIDLQADLNGDGYIGPPPKRDNPPILGQPMS